MNRELSEVRHAKRQTVRTVQSAATWLTPCRFFLFAERFQTITNVALINEKRYLYTFFTNPYYPCVKTKKRGRRYGNYIDYKGAMQKLQKPKSK